MGAVLVRAESFRLLTALSATSAATCRSLRPDLPDARIRPEEFADRVGTVTLAVFDGKQVNLSFRTTVGSPEYAVTLDGLQASDVRVSPTGDGGVVVSVSDVPLTVTRDRTESFYCSSSAGFSVTVVR
jgi:hypothetical protein